MKKSAVLFSLALFSCSLDYTKERNPESSTPEFVFANAHFSRTEKDKNTMNMTAAKIEQYKSDSVSVAKGAEFQTFDKDGQAETEGSCQRIIADTKKERYILLGAIEMNMISQEMKISAESLNFDRKNEQITSGTEQPVTILKNDAEISGTGFSASGVSKTFAFKKNVSGTIQTNDDKEDSEKK